MPLHFFPAVRHFIGRATAAIQRRHVIRRERKSFPKTRHLRLRSPDTIAVTTQINGIKTDVANSLPATSPETSHRFLLLRKPEISEFHARERRHFVKFNGRLSHMVPGKSRQRPRRVRRFQIPMNVTGVHHMARQNLQNRAQPLIPFFHAKTKHVESFFRDGRIQFEEPMFTWTSAFVIDTDAEMLQGYNVTRY